MQVLRSYNVAGGWWKGVGAADVAELLVADEECEGRAAVIVMVGPDKTPCAAARGGWQVKR
jgi:hypothetical protein